MYEQIIVTVHVMTTDWDEMNSCGQVVPETLYCVWSVPGIER